MKNSAKGRLAERIRQLKDSRRAMILAHFYQLPEIQDLADVVGDSLQLAQEAARSKAEVLVVCGVSFMAESAALLNPGKIVLLPEMQAGCAMADMASAEQLREARLRYPGSRVVSYVNSSAAVKAESDICCTSSNAERVVRSLPPEAEIIFVPDQNLAHWVQKRTGCRIIPWPGFCPVHNRLTAEDVHIMKRKHPLALVVAHPECRPEVLDLADEVTSTAGMLRFVAGSQAEDFIIATEEGLLHQLSGRFPDRKFYLASGHMRCADMKEITLEKVLQSLEQLAPRVELEPAVIPRARQALERMLALG